MTYQISNVYVFYFGDGVFVQWYAEYNPTGLLTDKTQMTHIIEVGI